MRGARVERRRRRGPDSSTRPSAAGRGDRAVAAEELGAVGGERPRPPVDVGEGDAAGEVGVERVAGQQGAGLGVDLGDDVHGRLRRGSVPSTHSA